MRVAPFLRRIGRSWRLAFSVILCIAIGTAGISAALTLVSAVLLRPLPFPEAERLVRIWRTEQGGESRISLSYPDLVDLSPALLDPVEGLDALEATARARLQFRTGDGVRRVEGEAVTAGYFDLLGVRPVVGRTFSSEEHRPGAERVMLLDYRAWGDRFAFDEKVVGRTIRTDEGEYTVIGVLPATFTGTVEDDSGELEFWVPIEQYLSAEQRADRSRGNIWAIGRIASDVGRDTLRSRVESVSAGLVEEFPDVYAAHSFVVEGIGENWRSGVRRGSLLLLVAAGLVLAAATLNVAVLFIAYSIERRRDVAIRTALGADRIRIVSQVLTEIVFLVGLGGLVGLALGPPLLRAFVYQQTLVDDGMLEIPLFARLEVDPTAAVLSCLALLVTALVAGAGPALLASRTDPARTLFEGGRTTTGGRNARRWTTTLIVAEVALTTVLLVGAALLGRSYEAMSERDLGFRTSDALRIGLFVNEDEVPASEELPQFYERVREDLAREPGVDKVGVVWPTVPIDWPIQRHLYVPGMDSPDPEHPEAGLSVGLFVADATFFEVVRIPVLAGRGFEPSDLPDTAAVALVSKSLAERIAAGMRREDYRSIVGATLRFRGEDDSVRIVGVVGNVLFGGPREEETPLAQNEIYLPFSQSPRRLMSLTISTHQDPSELIPSLTRRLTKIAPVSALDWIGPLDQLLADLFMRDTRFLLSLAGAFSLAGLLLSAVGLAAILANSVARRRHEIGVRRALGATSGHVLRAVIFQGLSVVGIGLVAGVILSRLAGNALASFVYGIPPTDWVSYVGAVVVLGGTAVAASLIPARSAARVDPARLMRED